MSNLDNVATRTCYVVDSSTLLIRRVFTVHRFDLVIFDCDGVLVDSERLAVRVETQILSELGWPLTESEIVRRFVGRSASYMQHDIEQHLGHAIDWDAVFEERYATIFERELTPVPGIIGALDRVTTTEVPERK